MTDRLKQLYQEMILEHNKNPRNFKKPDDFTHFAHGVNPLCGDDYWLFLNIKNDEIQDVFYYGVGCAISKSSGSLLTQAMKGKSCNNAKNIKDIFLKMISTDHTLSEEEKNVLSTLKVFEGVKKYPVRVKCATLIWRALEQALNPKSGDEVTTE